MKLYINTKCGRYSIALEDVGRLEITSDNWTSFYDSRGCFIVAYPSDCIENISESPCYDDVYSMERAMAATDQELHPAQIRWVDAKWIPVLW